MFSVEMMLRKTKPLEPDELFKSPQSSSDWFAFFYIFFTPSTQHETKKQNYLKACHNTGPRQTPVNILRNSFMFHNNTTPIFN